MSSPPENMKLEGLIADNWDDGAVTPGIVLLLEPYRSGIEQIAESFDPEAQSWRDYRSSVWAPVPEDVINTVNRIWANMEDDSASAATSSRWVLREGEPDIDNPEGVDLRVADRYELADIVCAGVVVPSFRRHDGDLIARVVFPPRCLRHRYIAGVGITVLLPMGIANIEGPTAPWKVSVQRYPESAQDLGAVPLATLATEVTRRGAFVVFDEAGLVDPNAAGIRDAHEALADWQRMAGPGHPLSEPIERAIASLNNVREPTKDQPEPVPTDGESIWGIVINDVQDTYGETGAREALLSDMRDRDRMGREKYGTPLQAHNGRDAMRDAYEEALDGTAYSRQAYEESVTPEGSDRALHIVYQDFLELAYRLRVIMSTKDRRENERG